MHARKVKQYNMKLQMYIKWIWITKVQALNTKGLRTNHHKHGPTPSVPFYLSLVTNPATNVRGKRLCCPYASPVHRIAQRTCGQQLQ